MTRRSNRRLAILAMFVLGVVSGGRAASNVPARPAPAPDLAPGVRAGAIEPLSDEELAAFRGRLVATMRRHLDSLLRNGKVVELKGKSADGMTALAFQLMHEITGEPRYRAAARELADRIVGAMRATRHGVLFIKEKDKGDGASIDGGGPPAFGWYVSAAGYILGREPGREADLRYLATVTDHFPWNANGWWANTVDVTTNVPKVPIAKPGAVNKNAGMALAAAMLGAAVRGIDPALATRLQAKADACVYRQIIPAQQSDGFWHYGLTGNDPNGKDILGYFMLTTEALMKLRHFTPVAARTPVLDAALEKAGVFARTQIAPMTDPNRGPAASRRTPGTPTRFALSGDPKRGFTLGLVLLAGGYQREGARTVDHWATKFPVGDRGQDGAKAADAFAHMLALLPEVGVR